MRTPFWLASALRVLQGHCPSCWSKGQTHIQSRVLNFPLGLFHTFPKESDVAVEPNSSIIVEITTTNTVVPPSLQTLIYVIYSLLISKFML